MSAVITATRATLGAIGRLSPRLAGELALPLFMRVGPRLPVRPEDRSTHESARRSEIRVRGRRVAVYEWGDGDEAVLLVHGWQGRAAQFAALVRELRAEGFTVVAFDAPANGDSEGRGTHILDYIDAIGQLERRSGGFRAIVGHSFGVLAAITAVTEGVRAERVVGIAGASDPDALVDGFSAQLSLARATADALRDTFARRVFPEEPDIYDRFSAVRHPLPENVPLLLVHDENDRRMPIEQSRRLLGAARGPAELVATDGLGHSRILAADATLDAVTAFIAGAGTPSRGRPARPVLGRIG